MSALAASTAATFAPTDVFEAASEASSNYERAVLAVAAFSRAVLVPKKANRLERPLTYGCMRTHVVALRANSIARTTTERASWLAGTEALWLRSFQTPRSTLRTSVGG